MIKSIEEIMKLINADDNYENWEELKEWADSIVQECADICITDDAIQEDILKLKDQIQ